jgi:hypothetical protein
MTNSCKEEAQVAKCNSWRPGSDELGPLQHSGKCILGGLRQDLRRRARYYVSDWVDAFKAENSQKTLSSTLFLFFACLSPAIAFGTLFDEGSEGSFGVVETIVSSAFAGIVYSICAGQPLAILGATGPILAYTSIFYNLSTEMLGLEFLPCYFWCGMWFSLVTVLTAIFDVSCLMQYVTKFTEEIFSGLISLIFIVEAIKPSIKAFYKKETDAAFFAGHAPRWHLQPCYKACQVEEYKLAECWHAKATFQLRSHHCHSYSLRRSSIVEGRRH